MIGAKFTDPQFVDANGVGGLNAAFGAVSGSIALLAAAGFVKPGLYQPELMTVAFSGLTATVGLPAPFAVINASGVVAQAHGTATGSDTQSYAIGFSGLVPGSGSIVAYCVAQTAIVQQNPVPIPGPPPGHPSYNPNYQPTIGYAQAVDTLALSTTTTPPDGMSAFELFRTTLTAGEGSITSWSTEYQQRTTPYWAAAPTVVAGGNLTFAQSQGMLVPASGGITSTLPLAASGTGLRYSCLNTSTGTWTISTTSPDVIQGALYSGGALSGSTSVALMPGAYFTVVSQADEWWIATASPAIAAPHGGQTWTASGAYTFTVPSGVWWLDYTVTGGGGGGTGNGNAQSGGAGGAGGTSKGRRAVSPGMTLTITVGAFGAGAAGASGTTVGGTGGTSSIVGTGINISATGGGGGANTTSTGDAGGSPGVGAGGQTNLYGGWGSDGQPANSEVTNAVYLRGGDGGASFWGGGGRAGSGGGEPGLAPGSGGGGAYSSSGASANGANGAPGIVELIW